MSSRWNSFLSWKDPRRGRPATAHWPYVANAVAIGFCSVFRTIVACVSVDGHAVVAACAWNLGMAAAVHIPMERLSINHPAYWRKRAKEARGMAEELADAFAKQAMLDIARSYDNLAVLTETCLASESSN